MSVGALFLMITLWATTSIAGTAGWERGVAATHFYTQSMTLSAFTSYTIETTDLSSGADTVLYVWDTNAKVQIAANDDYGGSLRSLVTIPWSSSARNIQVIVRSYNGGSAGTGTLRWTASGGVPMGTTISFNSGFARAVPNFAAGTHFMSIEEQLGSRDTLILVTSSTTNAIAFDDDSGPGLMSWVHMNSACSTGVCRVILGSYSPVPPTPTTLIWDEDIHNAALNCDSDGLSNALEAVVGSNACADDTDSDGLNDGQEIMGIDGPDFRLTRFPLMGSDPLQKDLFIQADWLECTDTETCNRGVDHWQMSPAGANGVAAYFAPDVRVHIDIGGDNSGVVGPVPNTTFGAWGGAARRPATSSTCADLGPRSTYFHAALLNNEYGGQSAQPGACLTSGVNARAFAHELGHSLNLSHGGLQSGGLDVNCKPNYRSMMNYAVDYEDPGVRFSRNEFAGAVLRPTSVNEQFGLGTTDPAKLGILDLASFQFAHNAAGAVDWNRDGIYASAPVRAAVTWASGVCDVGGNGHNLTRNDGWGSALGWLRGDGPEGFFAARLFWFTRRLSDNALLYRTTTRTALSTATGLAPVPWTPASTDHNSTVPATPVPGAPATSFEPSAAPYVDSSGAERLFVFSVAGGQLYAQSTGNNDSWSAPVAVGPANSEPAAVGYAGKVRVFVKSLLTDTLLAYTFDPAIGWSSSEVQTWSDGTTVKIGQGIGVTAGYVRSEAGPALELVALMPLAELAQPMELARYDVATGRWLRITTAWPWGPYTTSARPSIAYEPFAPEDDTWGRFYVSWRLPAQDGGQYVITFSQGNDFSNGATTRRGVFNNPLTFFFDQWHTGYGSLSLMYDTRYDRNLRAAWTADGGSVKDAHFSRLADQILDGELRDQDDYSVIRGALVCSLKGTACPP